MTHIVRVSFSKKSEWFIATSEDLRGLFVADRSLSVVYEEVPEVIKLMFKIKLGLDVDVKESSMVEKRPIDELVYIAESMAA